MSLKHKIYTFAFLMLVLVINTAITFADDEVVENDLYVGNSDVVVEEVSEFTNEDTSPAVVEEYYQTEANQPLDGIQSLTFKKNIGIQDALRFISLKYGRNIVPSPGVEGTLGFTTLHNVTFDEAMDAIMGNKYVHATKGNLTQVYTREEYQKLMGDKSRLKSKVFELYYISAAEAMKLVSPVLSKDAEIQGSTPAQRALPTGESITSGSDGGDSMALNDRLVIKDFPENLAEAEELLKKIDKRPKQVLVEATILAAKLTEDMQFGVDWTLLNDAGIRIQGFSGTSPANRGLSLAVSMDDVEALVTALETITDTTTMANPKVMAVNKQLGQVYIGRKIGYREGDTVGTGGVVTQGSVKFLDTGTKLSFRPYIGDDGYIRMDIQPKDSSGDLVDDGLGGKIPEETATELATNLMVKDGQTIVIGGLFRDKVTSSRSQVPILGDIPFAGVLFRRTVDTVEREEVIVLLKPHIITDPEELMAEERVEDIRRKVDAALGIPQWISRSHIAQKNYNDAVQAYLAGDYKQALKEVQCALNVRPSYLEALRLQEKLIAQLNGDVSQIERIMRVRVEADDTLSWSRY